MAYVNWNSRYSVKIKRFDEDHQHLFDIINQLHEAMKAGHGKDVLQRVLGELLRYSQEHFAREEAAMKSAGYLKLCAHAEQHRSFTGKMKEFARQYEAGAVALTVEILDFLTRWLSDHIVGTDQQYSDFLTARGVA